MSSIVDVIFTFLFYSPFQKQSREKTYLVFESCLRTLFTTCNDCKRATQLTFNTIGSMLQVKIICCVCESEWTWNSQPYVHGIPQGNILMSASVLFSGSLLSKVLRVFWIMNCASISERTFFYHQDKYLHPAVHTIWKENQTSMLTVLQVEQNSLVLGGDGWCDSPGFSAKHGSYSFIKIEHNVVLNVELVQVHVHVKSLP